MSKTMQAILEKDEEDVRKMADDMELFIKEHDAGQHKDGIVPFCERCAENRGDFFSTAGRDALSGLDGRTSREIYEDNMADPNPFN